MSPRVSVVVPNWNGHRYLPELLRCLEAQVFRDFETLVVDNGSEDGSLDFLARRGDVATLPLGRNLGFPAAVNRGIERAQGELVLLLNNDMEPAPGFLAALVAAADSHPEAGSFACKVRFRDDPERIDSAGDRLAASGRSYGIGRGERDGPRFAEPRLVFGGTGGAVLYRRATLVDAGRLDPDFFLYVEDTDLALRAQLRGWRCLYVPGAETLHVGSASMRGREDVRARYCLRNHLFLLLKDYPIALLPRHAGEVLRGIAVEVLFAFGATRVRRGSIAAAVAVLATIAAVLALAPKMLVRRLRFHPTVEPSRIEELFA